MPVNPMPTIRDLAPVLAVTRASMQPMLAFFTDQLGFSTDTLIGDPPQFAMLMRDGKTVMLTCDKDFTLPQKNWAVYFWIDDVEAMHAEALERGAKAGPLTNKPYDMVEFEITAPDGRIITFGQ